MSDHGRTDEVATVASDDLVRANQRRQCANCGRRIDTTEWHPLATERDDDGDFNVYAFCSEHCRDEWNGAD